MVKVSKSSNLPLYPLFFAYSDPDNIPYNVIAYQLRVEPNKLRALKGEAQRNVNIFLALLNEGYRDDQIPTWFKRPPGMLKKRTIAVSQFKVLEEPEIIPPRMTAPVSEPTPPALRSPVYTSKSERPYVLVRDGRVAGMEMLKHMDLEEYEHQQARLKEETDKAIKEIVTKVAEKHREEEKRRKNDEALQTFLRLQWIINNPSFSRGVNDLLHEAYSPIEDPLNKGTTLAEIKAYSKKVEHQQILRKFLKNLKLN